MLIDDIKNRINIIELAKSEGLQLKKQSNRSLCVFGRISVIGLVITKYTESNIMRSGMIMNW